MDLRNRIYQRNGENDIKFGLMNPKTNEITQGDYVQYMGGNIEMTCEVVNWMELNQDRIQWNHFECGSEASGSMK
jgi:hypothetical protein